MITATCCRERGKDPGVPALSGGVTRQRKTKNPVAAVAHALREPNLDETGYLI